MDMECVPPLIQGENLITTYKSKKQWEFMQKMIGGDSGSPSTILLLLPILHIFFQKTQGIVVSRLELRASNPIQKLVR